MGFVDDLVNARDARQYDPAKKLALEDQPSDKDVKYSIGPKAGGHKTPVLDLDKALKTNKQLRQHLDTDTYIHGDQSRLQGNVHLAFNQGDTMTDAPSPGSLPIDPQTGRPVITVGPRPTPVGTGATEPPPTRDTVQTAAATGRSFIENEVAKKKSDSDIDYSTGAPFATRVLLQRASNPDEAKAVLSKSWGEGNYGQDYKGNWWVKHDGKRVAVLPNTVTGSFENFAAGMAGSSAATGGAIAGGAVGEMVFPLGGGIPGAMVGAALGRGLDDLTKWAQGTFAQKPADVVSSLENEATLAGGFQAAGPLARRAWDPMRRFISTKIADTTPATRAMTRDIAGPTFGAPGKPSPFLNYRRWQNRNVPKGEAAQPPLGSYAPGLTGKEYKRTLRNAIRGKDPQEAGRIAYLDRRMRRILGQEGIPPGEIDKMMEEIHNTSYRISTTEAGVAVTDRARSVFSGIVNEGKAQLENARQMVAAANARFLGIGFRPSGLTSKDVHDAIVHERQRFSKMMSDVYRSVDRLTGDKPIVSTALIRKMAKNVRYALPKSAVPPIIKEYASKSAPREISFEQAHALRTLLREYGEMIDVQPLGQRKGYFARMAGAVNQAIHTVPDNISKSAKRLLDQADKTYNEGISRFHSSEINELVGGLRRGFIPDAGSVAKLIMKEDKPNLAKMIFKMLPDQTEANVIKADIRNMLNETMYTDNQGRTLVDGKALMDLLDRRRTLLNVTYPARLLKELRTYARGVAAFDGKIDVNSIKTPEGIIGAMQKALGAEKTAEIFAKENPLGALMSGRPTDVDAALRRITKPGDQAITESVAKELGIDSDEWRAVRRFTLQKLFADSVVETSSLGKTVAGKSIDENLNQFTKRQQDLLFPHGLADDLRLLSKEAKFLFPKRGEDIGQSFAAANIKTGIWLNPHADSKYLWTSLWGYVADHPRLIRFLADEIKRDPLYARSTMSVLGQWITDTVLEGGPGQGKPGQDLDPKGHVAPQPEPISFGGPHA